jgi:Xaa-Pro aminopeptidase
MTDLAELPPCDFRRRPGTVREALDGRTVIVSNPANVRWLTGFGGSLGWVVLGPERMVLVTDGRYAERAAADLDSSGLTATTELEVRHQRAEVTEAVVGAATALGGGTVLAEDEHLTHAVWLGLAERVQLGRAGDLVTAQRRVKDTGELARMARGASIADAALAEVASRLAERPTEADVRDELEAVMRRRGADGPSYDTIVASGPHGAARPHHRTGGRTIVDGDTVVIDVGALVDDYHSDMTRTFVVGEPSVRQAEVFAVVREAQLAGLAAVRAGVAAAAVDAACRAVVAGAGFGEWYLHNTGHGVGLEIHEEPFASPASAAVLLVGDVVTVEPGLYRDGFGGVRIEDLVTVTPTGCDLLTHLPKDAPCLPSPPTT